MDETSWPDRPTKTLEFRVSPTLRDEEAKVRMLVDGVEVGSETLPRGEVALYVTINDVRMTVWRGEV